MILLRNIVVAGLLLMLLFSSCGTKQGVIKSTKLEKSELDTIKYKLLLENPIVYKYNSETGSTTDLKFTNKNSYTLQAVKDKLLSEG